MRPHPSYTCWMKQTRASLDLGASGGLLQGVWVERVILWYKYQEVVATVPASCEVPPHQWQELYWSHLPGLRFRSGTSCSSIFIFSTWRLWFSLQLLSCPVVAVWNAKDRSNSWSSNSRGCGSEWCLSAHNFILIHDCSYGKVWNQIWRFVS